METNTIIELFEELKKQIAALGRKFDERQLSSIASPSSGTSQPAASAESSAELLQAMHQTHACIEQTRMELTDRIDTLAKAVARIELRRQLPPLRHLHIMDLRPSQALQCMGVAVLVIFSGALWIDSLYDRIRDMKTNDLKYRYIQMMGGIDGPALHELNALFYNTSRSQDRHALRQQVERYETAVREAIESQQRNTTQIQKAEKIKQKFLTPQKESKK